MSVVPRRKASPPSCAGHIRAPLRSLADVLSVGAATPPLAPPPSPPVPSNSGTPTTDPFPWYPAWKKKQEELLAKGRKDGEQINKRLQEELQKYKDTIDELQRVIGDQIDKEMDVRNQEILKSKKELAVQDVKLKGLVDQVARLKAELQSKSDELTKAEEDALRKVENPALQKQISILQQEIRLLEQTKMDEIKSLNDKIAILEKVRARNEVEIKSLTATVQEMEAELNNMEAESSSEKKALQQELLKYKYDLEKAERVASELQSSVETANTLFLTEQNRMAAVSKLVKQEILQLKEIIDEVKSDEFVIYEDAPEDLPEIPPYVDFDPAVNPRGPTRPAPKTPLNKQQSAPAIPLRKQQSAPETSLNKQKSAQEKPLDRQLSANL